MRYTTNAEYQARARYASDQVTKLRALVVELVAALVRIDRNGYQQKLIDRALKEATITRDDVDKFNVERAAKIEAWKATRNDG